MPSYNYHCESCDHDFDVKKPSVDYAREEPCPKCGATPAKRMIAPVGFALKGSGWVGRDMKMNRDMTARNERARQRMKDHVSPGPKLLPNVDGQVCDSWRDAKSLAGSKGYDTTGYDAKIREEKK